jgi:hypothetical protein
MGTLQGVGGARHARDSSEAIQRTDPSTVNVQTFSQIAGIHRGDIRAGGRTVDTGAMKPLDWAEEHWDVLAMAAAFALAVAVSVALSIAYNVAAARLDPFSPAPPSVEVGSPSPPAEPLPWAVPYS